MSIIVQDRGYVAGRGPSPIIWADCPVEEIIADPTKGIHFFDDFINFAPITTAGASGGYYGYIDGGNTIQQLATEINGVVRLALDTTDDDESCLITGGNTAGMVKVLSTAFKKLWFEARVRTSEVTTAGGLFVGLIEEASADGDLVADGCGALTTADYVGFRVLDDDNDGLDAAYRCYNQTEQVVQNAAQVLEADTWYKVGLSVDETGILRYYVNGAQVGSNVQWSDAATFPDGEELALAIARKNGTGAADSIDIDWWRCAQLA